MCTTSYSQFPCGLCAAGLISASTIQMLLFICLLWLHLLTCQLMSNQLLYLKALHLVFLSSQPCMIIALSAYRFPSLVVASCISCIDMHTGRSIVVLILLTFMLRPDISLSSLPSWLWHDNQSATNSSVPGLYSMHTMY